MNEATPKQPLIQDANLDNNQMLKLLATLVAKLQRAGGGPLVITIDEVQETEVGLDVKILGGKNFVITAIDPNAPSIVRADATVLARLKNGSALAGIG